MKTEGFLVLLGLLGGLAQVSETNVVPLEAAFQGKLHFLDFKISFSFMLTSVKIFLSNSQFKSKHKQKLERWLVGLESTRKNNQNKKD